MKKLILFLVILAFTSCFKSKGPEKQNRLYFLHSCNKDTSFIAKPDFDTAKLNVIATKTFYNHGKFAGQVLKLAIPSPPVDGGHVYYFTKELGIIYSKSTTWPCYSRLHSTNDSIEKRINEYLEHILSCTDFVIEGDVPLKYYIEKLK